MFLDVATQPHPADLFMAASSRHYWAQMVGQNLMDFDKGFWLCGQQKRLQPGRRSPVQ
jgi:hypothetical protein